MDLSRSPSAIRRTTTGIVGAAMALLLGACTSPVNPSFPVTMQEAYRDLERMRAEPQPLERPLVILGGYMDPGFAPGEIERVLRTTVSGGPIIQLTFATARCFDECRDRVLDVVLAAIPERTEVAPGRFETVEIDVIGNSMGGLVARYAALWPAPPDTDVDETEPTTHVDTRLRIVRLFTLSTPHRGAAMAKPRSANRLERDMVPESDFLGALDLALDSADYQIVSYTRIGDAIVGVENAAPVGRVAYWVVPPPLEAAHLLQSHDRRLLADIARRLRGEEPFTIGPPAPLPE